MNRDSSKKITLNLGVIRNFLEKRTQATKSGSLYEFLWNIWRYLQVIKVIIVKTFLFLSLFLSFSFFFFLSFRCYKILIERNIRILFDTRNSCILLLGIHSSQTNLLHSQFQFHIFTYSIFPLFNLSYYVIHVIPSNLSLHRFHVIYRSPRCVKRLIEVHT